MTDGKGLQTKHTTRNDCSNLRGPQELNYFVCHGQGFRSLFTSESF
jgi:hypothetical protein